MNTKMHGRENDSVEVVGEVPKSAVALREEAIQAFWEEHDIFNKTLATPAGQAPKGEYVFYDGPPFATGLPHYGHLLAGTIKDVVPRFWTMQGYRVRRQWGWDCHGLPVENLIEKKLGLATKRDIEVYGIKNFNEAAREAVLEYADDWRKVVPRMGRFVDMEHDYKTMDSTYTESVWWVFKALHDKGLVFEGFKSMHLCPRCGTTLSNFEVNLGYKDIKDISVFVEFPLVDEPNTSFVAWTTTPWTLPGNMALAVNQDFEYAVVEVSSEAGVKRLILAKERVAAVLKDTEYKVVEVRNGTELLGKKYEPLFPWLKDHIVLGTEKGWQVFQADFVEEGGEGTGIVHIAPAYGEDDLKLGQEHGLPIVHHVDESGHFKDFVSDFAGRLVKPKDDVEAEVNHMDADIEVIRALAAKGRLFDKEKITHSYPHCWRCDTPLLNYATTSWFVDVPKIKDELVAANATVQWVPEHVGTNRFGKWLEGARDWAVSRQRYWGAPLPIWRNPETKEYHVCGSVAQLQQFVPRSGNQYFLMRHGESESNVQGIISARKEHKDGLTENGKQQVVAAFKNLPTHIDYIIHSGFERTEETAKLVATQHPEALVLEDDRIREFDVADVFEGKTWAEYNGQFSSWVDRYYRKIEGSENRRDVQIRAGQFIEDIERSYTDKIILVIGHAGSLFGIESAAAGKSPEVLREQVAALESTEQVFLSNAEVRSLTYIPYPHNDHYELDFHRPYIDEFAVYEKGVKLERVPDVFDCWFESGSMPYAQNHYPFENLQSFNAEKSRGFPAQFIAESIDQTRGWFYSLIVIGTALFGKSPYEHVITNGLVLAEDGKKMSKSLQNYPDPMELVSRVGADAIRYYLLSSPLIRGEDLNFSEKEVLEQQRKNLGRLHNVLAMYEIYADDTPARADSTHVLDTWIIARLNETIRYTTDGYEGYELDKATRSIEGLIDDVSVWYLRRSRERLKSASVSDRVATLATLRYVLKNLALVMAPVMPFYAEYLFLRVREDGEAESVHLMPWPKGGEVDTVVLGEMSMVREFVTLALEARTKAHSKVRQPLQSLSINVELKEAYRDIIAEEVNVKSILCVSTQSQRLILDTTPTPELLAEGAVRELMRAVQESRKAAGLAPQDVVTLTVDTSEAGQAAITGHQALLTQTVGASTLTFTPIDGQVLVVGEYRFVFGITKV